MAPAATSNSEEISHLKYLLNLAQERIAKLEAENSKNDKKSHELRMVLMGPPGAGECI